jgi:hypothetical protein
MRRLIIGLAAAAGVMAAATSLAAPAKKPAGQGDADYGRNLISVVTPGRASAFAPTGDCIVWVNAEGLGVGPAQLGGLHGVTLHINLKPLPGEAASGFPDAMASLKASYPNAPPWLLATIQKQRPAIEAGCAQDHPEPLKVHSITAADRGGK